MKTLHVRHSLLVLAASLLTPICANAFSLAWPIDCELGKTCFIQNFIDHDTTSGAKDFACNPTTFDTLSGTDIRILSLAAMRAGVTVRAAADGVVAGIRNDMEDVNQLDKAAPSVAGTECGNGVRLQHANGYRTMYCHLKKGSITVRAGQLVKAGDTLGLVGLSGETEFPHLHLNVMKDGAHLDPFTSTAMTTPCNAKLVGTAPQLWAKPVTYAPTNLLSDGILDHATTNAAMLDTPSTLTTVSAKAPALVYWAEMLNLRAGDIVSIAIHAPDGSVVADHIETLPRNQAVVFRTIGKKNSSGNFTAGTYQTGITVMRENALVIDVTRSVNVQ